MATAKGRRLIGRESTVTELLKLLACPLVRLAGALGFSDHPAHSQQYLMAAPRARTRSFFESVGMRTRLRDYDLGADQIDAVVTQLEAHGMAALGERQDVTLAQSRQILEASW